MRVIVAVIVCLASVATADVANDGDRFIHRRVGQVPKSAAEVCATLGMERDTAIISVNLAAEQLVRADGRLASAEKGDGTDLAAMRKWHAEVVAWKSTKDDELTLAIGRHRQCLNDAEVAIAEQTRIDRAPVVLAQQQAARVVQLRETPAVRRLANSASLCVLALERKDLLKEIAIERKYARIGGVQNNAKLYGLQTQVRENDETTAEIRTDLGKLKPLACSNKIVRRVTACVMADSGEKCDDKASDDGYTLFVAGRE